MDAIRKSSTVVRAMPRFDAKGLLSGISLALAAGLCATAPAIAADPGVTNDTITIGVFGPRTGPANIYRLIDEGAIAVYNEANAAGGINGRKLKVIYEDDGCDPTKTRAAVKKLIYQDKVFLIHGGNCTSGVLAVKDEIVENKVPYMVMGATSRKIAAPVNPYVFTTVGLGDFVGQAMVAFGNSVPNVKKAVIVRHPDEWAEDFTKTILANAKPNAAPTVIEVTRNITDATTQVLQVKNMGADLVYVVLYLPESSVFFRDALKYGLKPVFVTTSTTTDFPDLAKRSGGEAAIANVFAVSSLKAPFGTEAVKKESDIFSRNFPNEPTMSFSLMGMSGAYAVVEGLKRAGPNLTRESYVKALETINGAPAGPAACDIKFSPTQHEGCRDMTVWTSIGGKPTDIGRTWRKKN